MAERKNPVPEAALREGRFAVDLLAWYDRHRRDLPWRSPPGALADPYRVWLSEIMLQQTTVTAVRPFYARFLALWPDVSSLANASIDQVMQAWAGLGYYSRARNLHACAQRVAQDHSGRFPDTEGELRALPGIGSYTAAAIAAIAFDRRAVVVDGNVERVMARLHAVETPLPRAKPRLWSAMDAATPDRRTGDFAQAVMDLGATICTPRSPACVICPVRAHCRAVATGDPVGYPRKLPKLAVPTRRGAVFFIRRKDGSILVRTRPPHGLFGGMTELPGTAWDETFTPSADMPLPFPVSGPLTSLGTVQHGLTHFTLVLHVFEAAAMTADADGHRWIEPRDAHMHGLPTLMMKVVERGLQAAG